MATNLLSRGEMKRELKEVRALLKQHAATHAGCQTAVAFIESVLLRARYGDDTIPAVHVFARLAANGVRALRILEEAAAVYLYQMRQRYHFYSDDHFRACMGAAIARLAPLDRVTRYIDGCAVQKPRDVRSGRVVLGRFVCETLSRLLVGIGHEIMSRNFELPEQKESLRTEFTDKGDV
jgi:hypothetical protein